MANALHELSEDVFQYHTLLLKDLNLTVDWVNSGGEVVIDQAFVERHWHDLITVNETRPRVIAYHIHVLNLQRDLWSTNDIEPPYGCQYQAILPDSQTIWSELNITLFPAPSNEQLHTSLLDILGVDLPAIANSNMLSTAPRLAQRGDGTRLLHLPVSQVWIATRELGFKSLSYPSSGLLINGEDQHYRPDLLLSIVSGFAARFAETDNERTVKVIPFIAGCHAARLPPDPLAGVCGLLRCLTAQLVHQYHGKLGLSFLSDQYLCKILHNNFMALLYLFKHLILAIGWAGTHTTLQHVTIIVDGIDHVETPEHMEQWSNFVRVLRELVFRIREIPDAASAYLARGLNFKYVLVHPTVSNMDACKYEAVVSRTDVPEETSGQELGFRDMGSGSVWAGGRRLNSTAEAVAVLDAGVASRAGGRVNTARGMQNGHR